MKSNLTCDENEYLNFDLKENEKSNIRKEFINFFQFIFENDLREEALNIINLYLQRGKKI